jgi:hypothetical protein
VIGDHVEVSTSSKLSAERGVLAMYSPNAPVSLASADWMNRDTLAPPPTVRLNASPAASGDGAAATTLACGSATATPGTAHAIATPTRNIYSERRTDRAS